MYIIGICRFRNSKDTLKDVLDHLESIVTEVILYDDASDDTSVLIANNHRLVSKVIRNDHWETDPAMRAQAEGVHRQILFDAASKKKPDWIYVFDADEFIELDVDISLGDRNIDTLSFRLFDFYITEEDKDLNYLNRKWIGPEYRDIPMFFRPSEGLKFYSRVPRGCLNVKLSGYVRHYGKAISVQAWEDKCFYYINHLNEDQPNSKTIKDKWLERFGKAIHTKSDFNRELIYWDDKEDLGFELSNKFESFTSKRLNILVANFSLENVGGTETFTYTFIEELINYSNFNVEYFTVKKGLVSEKIENNLKVKFLSMSEYDVIYFNHNTVLDKLKRYHNIKGCFIQTCHGIYPNLEQPNKEADAFVSISQEVQNHLALVGYNSIIIPNMINVTRFRSLKLINDTPKVILSLCHSKAANEMIKEVALANKLEYLEAFKYDKSIWDIERIINHSDIVVGLGRSALEAAACGRPVIVFDKREYFESYGDGYLPGILGLSLQNNCSGRYSKEIFSKNNLNRELRKYNPSDGLTLREFAIKNLSSQGAVLRYLTYFEEIRNEQVQNTFNYQLKRKIEILKNKGIKKFSKLAIMKFKPSN